MRRGAGGRGQQRAGRRLAHVSWQPADPQDKTLILPLPLSAITQLNGRTPPAPCCCTTPACYPFMRTHSKCIMAPVAPGDCLHQRCSWSTAVLLQPHSSTCAANIGLATLAYNEGKIVRSSGLPGKTVPKFFWSGFPTLCGLPVLAWSVAAPACMQLDVLPCSKKDVQLGTTQVVRMGRGAVSTMHTPPLPAAACAATHRCPAWDTFLFPVPLQCAIRCNRPHAQQAYNITSGQTPARRLCCARRLLQLSLVTHHTSL